MGLIRRFALVDRRLDDYGVHTYIARAHARATVTG
jgi:hypothetical protein